MKTHWTADIFPLQDEDVDAIAEDIRANGQQLPILTLKDGSIVDGRNRWLACKKLKIEPITEVIENGEAKSDEELFALAVSMNGKRRSTTKGQQACAAALAWKRLYPEGAPNTGRSKCKNALGFGEFAQKRFGVSERLAKQALAVHNWSEEAFAHAMKVGSLLDTYQQLNEARKNEKQAEADRECINKHEDLAAKVDNGEMTLKEAAIIARQRDGESLEKERIRKEHIEAVGRFVDQVSRFHQTETQDVLDYLSDCPKADAVKAGIAKTVKMLSEIK